MDNRENYRSIVKRTGYEFMPPYMEMCPSLTDKFERYCRENDFEFELPVVKVSMAAEPSASEEVFLKYYDRTFKPDTVIDMWGCAHEKGSSAAFHMTRMYHPMQNFDSVEQVLEYPFPRLSSTVSEQNRIIAEKAKQDGKIVQGDLWSAGWEQSWYLRSMEELMSDMMLDEPIAQVLFDKVTDVFVCLAEDLARSGVDQIFTGDDIGTQNRIMMSEELYCQWLLPRLKRIISAVKAINPEITVFYHSCGYITPMIPYLIEAGVDVLNPIQPESMDWAEIHEAYGDRLSFHGTIGTQSTMPFGTPDDVRRCVFKNLEIAGDKGGLLVAPTHLLEPEVPIENVVAYINACRDFK